MFMFRRVGFFFLPLLAAAGVLLYLGGCNHPTTDAPPTNGSASGADKAQGTKASDAHGSGEHVHKPGGHGGSIVEIGRDNYHAEAVFEKGGTLRLYTLGKDEGRVQEVESQTLVAYIKSEGVSESTSVLLKPEPQTGDSEGKTSRFAGTLPKELWGQAVEVTVPNIRIAGERFRFAFSNASAAHGEDLMPDRVADEEEQKLYLTPGGKYTEADIKANGSVTASERFKSLKASHDLRPNAGDKICPITLTKANPKFTWVVGGKVYEFCCPPCVDEFVKTAKEHPEDIKEPGQYVKK